ncbi:MAG: hypothetical protein QNJ97_02205 [Myxococcota bacterium]|nr:hypothetical protein [Myxococcota bacterium]
MKTIRRVLLVVGLAASVVVSGDYGSVRADDSGTEASGGVDIKIRSDKSLSGEEQISWIEQKTDSARIISNHVQNMLDQARKEKDTLKIDCLDDKLTQIRVNLVGIEERTETLKLAVGSGDTNTANQQFAILRIYVSKIEGLRAEAENCVGDIDVLLGQTQTVVTVDDDITPHDPADDVPVVIIVDVDPFPTVSKYR